MILILFSFSLKYPIHQAIHSTLLTNNYSIHNTADPFDTYSIRLRINTLTHVCSVKYTNILIPTSFDERIKSLHKLFL